MHCLFHCYVILVEIQSDTTCDAGLSENENDVDDVVDDIVEDKVDDVDDDDDVDDVDIQGVNSGVRQSSPFVARAVNLPTVSNKMIINMMIMMAKLSNVINNHKSQCQAFAANSYPPKNCVIREAIAHGFFRPCSVS